MAYAGLFKVWTTVLAAILVAVLLFTASTTGAGAQEPDCKGQVVLDAGHGGTDSGAVNTEYNPATANERPLPRRNRPLTSQTGWKPSSRRKATGSA